MGSLHAAPPLAAGSFACVAATFCSALRQQVIVATQLEWSRVGVFFLFFFCDGVKSARGDKPQLGAGVTAGLHSCVFWLDSAQLPCKLKHETSESCC